MVSKQKKFKLFTGYTSIKQQQNKYREVDERKISQTISKQSASDDVFAALGYHRVDRRRGLALLAHRSRPASSTTQVFARFQKTGQFGVPEIISGTPGHVTIKRDSPVQNGTSGHVSHDLNTLFWGFCFDCNGTCILVSSRYVILWIGKSHC